jgi:hypothetical protein
VTKPLPLQKDPRVLEGGEKKRGLYSFFASRALPPKTSAPPPPPSTEELRVLLPVNTKVVRGTEHHAAGSTSSPLH